MNEEAASHAASRIEAARPRSHRIDRAPARAELDCEDYCAELGRWLNGADGDDDDALYEAGVELCRRARARDIAAEHVLIALHAQGIPLPGGADYERGRQDRRYVHAVRLLMETYFRGEQR